MSLRERNDCTLEALVPKASAIHSSDLPASTHSRICLMCGLRAMRFFESAMLPTSPYLPLSVPPVRCGKDCSVIINCTNNILPSEQFCNFKAFDPEGRVPLGVAARRTKHRVP